MTDNTLPPGATRVTSEQIDEATGRTIGKSPALAAAYGDPIMNHFSYDHLPPHLRIVSQPFGDLARALDEKIPDGPEKSAGLRKLLEAKDCMVRASLGA